MCAPEHHFLCIIGPSIIRTQLLLTFEHNPGSYRPYDGVYTLQRAIQVNVYICLLLLDGCRLHKNIIVQLSKLKQEFKTFAKPIDPVTLAIATYLRNTKSIINCFSLHLEVQ